MTSFDGFTCVYEVKRKFSLSSSRCGRGFGVEIRDKKFKTNYIEANEASNNVLDKNDPTFRIHFSCLLTNASERGTVS